MIRGGRSAQVCESIHQAFQGDRLHGLAFVREYENQERG